MFELKSLQVVCKNAIGSIFFFFFALTQYDLHEKLRTNVRLQKGLIYDYELSW